MVDTRNPWKKVVLDHCSFVPLQKLYIKEGRETNECEYLSNTKYIKEHVAKRLKHEVWDEEKRFENPHLHYLDMSPALYKLKMDMLNEHGAIEK